MKLARYSCLFFLMLAGLSAAFYNFSGAISARQSENIRFRIFEDFKFAKQTRNSAINYHSESLETNKLIVVKRPTDGGIRETISPKHLEKYKKWKAEFIATEFGQQQWEYYTENQNFVLNIVVSDKKNQGAGTGKYEWDAQGNLVGATIILGDKIDKGYPDPIYFPVMNSLSLEKPPTVSGEILAAAKIAHEFGHVNQTAKTGSDIFQRQNELMPTYNSILLKNGYNTKDEKLVELAEKMGGTPVKIWEDREYWGETSAMSYLIERLDHENFYCTVFNRLENNINLYAESYKERFEEVANAHDSLTECRR